MYGLMAVFCALIRVLVTKLIKFYSWNIYIQYVNYTSVELIKTEIKEKSWQHYYCWTLAHLAEVCPLRAIAGRRWGEVCVRPLWATTPSLPCVGMLTHILGLLHQDCSLCSQNRGKKREADWSMVGISHWPTTPTQGTPSAKASEAAVHPWPDLKNTSSPDHRCHPLSSGHLKCFHRGQTFYYPNLNVSLSWRLFILMCKQAILFLSQRRFWELEEMREQVRVGTPLDSGSLCTRKC